MSPLWSAIRSAWSHLAHHPTHCSFVLISLALGIGANTAIFAVAHAALLRPLPYDDPQSLVMIWRMPRDRPSVFAGFGDGAELSRQISTAAMFQEWRSSDAFEDAAAIEIWQSSPSSEVDVQIGDSFERLRGAQVTPNFFGVLGISATLGRTFRDDDRDVAVLSSGLWRRAFGGDPAVVGSTLRLTLGRDRQPRSVTVVGVLPSQFSFTYPAGSEIFVPIPWTELRSAPQNALRYQTVARLRHGVTVESASAVIDSIYSAHEDARGIPARARSRTWLEPIHEYAVGRTRPALALLLSVTCVVLVICCASVTTLFVAQGVTRRREIGIRRALGASRTQVAAQLVSESVILSAAATAVSMLVLWWLVPTITTLLPPKIPRVDEVGIDVITVGWATLTGMLTIALISFVPVALVSSVEPATILASYPAGTPRPRANLLRQTLIGIQVALVTLLLIVGGRLIHGFWQLANQDLGFEVHGLVTAEIRLLDPAYRVSSRREAFREQLLARIRAIPSVTGASVTSAIPLRGVDSTRLITPASGGARQMVNERHVDRQYFELMGIPLLEGRLFEATDDAGAGPVAVVSQSLAARLYDGDPIGRLLDSTTPATIVGVVGDVRSLSVDRAANPAYYLHWPQGSSTIMWVLIRTNQVGAPLEAAVAAAVRSIAPTQPIKELTTLDAIVTSTIVDRRFFGIATSALSIVTMFLALVAIFGVHATTIAERTREFGIRAAVGATPASQVAGVTASGALPIALGSSAGAIGAWWAVQLVQRFVFSIGETSPSVFGIAILVVAGMSITACVLPATRIARLDIATTLRAD